MLVPRYISLVSRSDALPFDLDEIKKFLRVEHNDDDQAISLLARRAVMESERYTAQAIVEQRWKFTYDRPMKVNRIELFITPARRVESCHLVDHAGKKKRYNEQYITDISKDGITMDPVPIYHNMVIEYTAGFVIQEEDKLPDGLKGVLFNHVSCLYDGSGSFNMQEYALYKNKWL